MVVTGMGFSMATMDSAPSPNKLFMPLFFVCHHAVTVTDEAFQEIAVFSTRQEVLFSFYVGKRIESTCIHKTSNTFLCRNLS